jgi:hypothetical protein
MSHKKFVLWSSGLACSVVLAVVIFIFKVRVGHGCNRLHRQVCMGGVFCTKLVRVFCTPSKVKMVKLSLSLLWRHIEGSRGIAPLTEWRWVVTFLPQLHYPWERMPVLTKYEDGANLVGPRAGLDILTKSISCLFHNSNHGSSTL